MSKKGYKLTEEHKRKIAEYRKGKPQSEETKKKIAEKRLGFKFSEETLQKMSDSHIGQEGYWTGKKRSEETKTKISKNRKNKNGGDKNPNWLGGKSQEKYTPMWRLISKNIRERDNYICQVCLKKEDGKAFDVHHIDYNKQNIQSENLITLCRKCHSKTGAKRTMWTDFFLTRNNRRLCV